MSRFQFNRRQVVLSGALLLLSAPVAKAHNGVVHVSIEKMAFVPADIEVRVGETIEWTNNDVFAHTATVKGAWEVVMAPGKVATRVVEAGDSGEYYCRFHPNMKGRIKVVS